MSYSSINIQKCNSWKTSRANLTTMVKLGVTWCNYPRSFSDLDLLTTKTWLKMIRNFGIMFKTVLPTLRNTQGCEWFSEDYSECFLVLDTLLRVYIFNTRKILRVHKNSMLWVYTPMGTFRVSELYLYS